MSRSTIGACLRTLGVTGAELAGCASLEEQFREVKRLYFKGILAAHPDKVGCGAWGFFGALVWGFGRP
jgi:hypothetical protein